MYRAHIPIRYLNQPQSDGAGRPKKLVFGRLSKRTEPGIEGGLAAMVAKMAVCRSDLTQQLSVAWFRNVFAGLLATVVLILFLILLP